jgi:carbon-monoxide dehydrogenase small subunit
MSRVSLTVNGAAVTAEVEPRTHLADFLREDRLLTGTHLGCEHGVCGACTLLIDDAPARSCIAYAVACDGADVRTIEGLEDDPVIVRLRAAFTEEHALQCGYCTPGMLVTARDVVQRLPNADEARVRLELAGNLCRCTGYAGIVRAIRRVLAEGVPVTVATPSPLPALAVMPTPFPVPMSTASKGTEVVQTLRIGLARSAVWAAVRDPALIAACVPGARLTTNDGDRLSGEVRAALGPIDTLFVGHGSVAFNDAEWRAKITGEGRDARTGTRLSAHAVLVLLELDATATAATLSIDYTLRGPLAQFARGAVAREFAAEIAQIAASNLEMRLSGRQPAPARRLTVGKLMLRAIWRRLCAMLVEARGASHFRSRSGRT